MRIIFTKTLKKKGEEGLLCVLSSTILRNGGVFSSLNLFIFVLVCFGFWLVI